MNVDNLLNTLYDYENVVSIHIRRTDYLKKQQFHNVLTVDYYKKAINYFKGFKFKYKFQMEFKSREY